MAYFLYKLIPPRPAFPDGMSDAESAIMQRHFAYWAAHVESGTAVVFGPVVDPSGNYAIAVLELEDGADPSALGVEDPAITANAGFRFEVHPMPQITKAGAPSRR